MIELTFKNWLLRFSEVNLPIGDLAREVKDDKSFPIQNSHKAILNYLENQHAGDPAIVTFENAWSYYSAEHVR